MVVGSVLLAMFFVADWCWPGARRMPAQASAESPVEQGIRIHSAQKWPEKVVFDTSIPTIVPASPPPLIVLQAPAAAPLVTASAAPNPALEAHAEIKRSARPAPPRHPIRVARQHRAPPRLAPPGSTWAAAGPMMAPPWGFSW